MITIICATNRPGNRTQIIAKSYAEILEEIKEAQKAVEIDDVDEAVNFLKKFSK